MMLRCVHSPAGPSRSARTLAPKFAASRCCTSPWNSANHEDCVTCSAVQHGDPHSCGRLGTHIAHTGSFKLNGHVHIRREPQLLTTYAQHRSASAPRRALMRSLSRAQVTSPRAAACLWRQRRRWARCLCHAPQWSQRAHRRPPGPGSCRQGRQSPRQWRPTAEAPAHACSTTDQIITTQGMHDNRCGRLSSM